MLKTEFKATAANLTVLRLPGDGESSLIARSATETALMVAGCLEGELIGRETVATNRAGSGQRSVEIDTVVIEHDPGLLAERQTLEFIIRAIDSELDAAKTGSAEHYAEASVALQAVLSDAGTLPGDITAALDRTAIVTIEQAVRTRTDLNREADFVQAVANADVSRGVDDALNSVRQRIRLNTARLLRQRDAHLASGRVGAARGIDRAIDEWADAVGARLGQDRQRLEAQAEDRLVVVNQTLEGGDDEDARPIAGLFGKLQGSLRAFFYQPDSRPFIQDVRRPLEQHLSARLAATATASLCATVSALKRNRLNQRAMDRVLGAFSQVRDSAAAALLGLDEMVQERQRRVNGIFVPADRDICQELLKQLVDSQFGALTQALIHGPVAAQLSGGAIDVGRFEDEILLAARRLTRPLREASLAQVISQLSPARLDTLAKALLAANPGLEFRSGDPAPAVYRRVAVPGGPTSALGEAVRRRAPEVDVTPIDTSSQPLTAYGVAITEVFSVNQLAGFHGQWLTAREKARGEGTAARLVSDRRFLEMTDGVLDDGELDEMVVMAIGCDVMAPSKEGQSSGAGGTWYLIPDGQDQRPAQVDPARLDSVFRGQRLGRSLQEIRRTLRNNPRHREWVAKQWGAWCRETAPSDRAARLAQVINGAILPSDELVPIARSVKNKELRQARATLTEVA